MVYLLALRSFHRTFDQKLKRSRVQGKAGPHIVVFFPYQEPFHCLPPSLQQKWWASNPMVE